MWQGLHRATYLKISFQAFTTPGVYLQLGAFLAKSSPALVIALPVALVTYAVWNRARYFGNTAPLLVVLVFLLMGLGAPHYPGLGFQLMALPFLFVFVAGVAADLLETKHRNLVLASTWGILSAYAIWNVAELLRVGTS